MPRSRDAAYYCRGVTRSTKKGKRRRCFMLDVKAEEKIAEEKILIVGAGPSGLALAAELKRRGVSAVIVDQEPAGANTSRACVVHARTMEVLEPLGVTRDLLADGVKVPIFRVRDRDRPLLTIDFLGYSEFLSVYADDSAEQGRTDPAATSGRSWLQCYAAMQVDPFHDVAFVGRSANSGQRFRPIDQGPVADRL